MKSLAHLLFRVLLVTGFLCSCNKHTPSPTRIPSTSKHVLLKDITVPSLPSPYYHFEYNADSLITKASFASDYTRYNVLYQNQRISELRNNILVNHDTLRYVYDDSGKPTAIHFINDAGDVFRHAYFVYKNDLIKTITWDRKLNDGSFFVDRTLSFTFYGNGNVNTITEHRPPMPGIEDYRSVRTFADYDSSINVDDFTYIHDGIHDHLFLLQGFRIQQNNPRLETLSVNGEMLYTIDYTYGYNGNNTPSQRLGDFLYLSGQYKGRMFKTQTYFSYY